MYFSAKVSKTKQLANLSEIFLLKLGLPAFPIFFAILGTWLYWSQNISYKLPVVFSFWGVVIMYYLTIQLIRLGKYLIVPLTLFITQAWFMSNCLSHTLYYGNKYIPSALLQRTQKIQIIYSVKYP